MQPARIAATIIFLFTSSLLADSITLKDGSVNEGDIISETDSQIVMKVRKAHGSIIVKDTFAKADIKNIERDAPEVKQEHLAYDALDLLRLDPNREYTKSEYQSALAAFNKFLSSYPASPFAADVRHRAAAWSNEIPHVDRGQAKLNNEWMTPEQKRSRIEAQTLATLQARLADLQARKKQTEQAMSDAPRRMGAPNRDQLNGTLSQLTDQIDSTTRQIEAIEASQKAAASAPKTP